FGLHAAFTLSNETLEKCKNAMKDLNAGYHVHVAEGYSDLTFSLKNYGKRVVERLNEYGIFRENTLAVHCIHTNEHEMNILKDSKCNVVHNPESNMGNAVGCSPVINMISKGIKVGLGTDGYTSDMTESLKVANIIHKHHLCDPTVAWGEAPLMIFENNREIAKKQFGCETGIIKSGAKADVIVLDYIPHTELNGNNYSGHILFGLSGKYTVSTIIDGKFVMKDRKLIGVDEEAILEKAREVSKKMWERFAK
ncbi:MAG: amidohydrolase family protein, partial [Fusobacteriaceae bacterium]